MREIKFRAWDKKDKVMREVYGIQFPKISNNGNRENTIIEMHCTDYEGQKAIILSDFTDNVERVELMQYTGLKDKNRKEIYEGDIVMDTELGNYKMVVDAVWVARKIIDMDKCNNTMGGVIIVGNTYETPEVRKQ